MGDFFTQNDTTSDLVNLAFGVTDIAMQSAHKCPENAVYRAQQDPGGVGTLQDVFCLIKIDLMGLLDRVFLFFAFLLILGGGVFQFLNSAVLFFELPDVVFALPPESESTLLTQIRALFNGFTDGIIEQADIGWEVDVSFYDKGIAATADLFRGFVFFFNKRCPARTTS